MNYVDLWGLEKFSNGNDRLTGTENFHDSNIPVDVTVIPTSSTKVDVYVSADLGGTNIPTNVDVTINYNTDGKKGSTTVSSPDPTEGKGSPDVASKSTGYFNGTKVEVEQLGKGVGVNLPNTVTVTDITNVTVTVTSVDTKETVTVSISAKNK